MKQAIHHVVRGLYFPYCFDSRLNLPLALSTSLGATAILANFRRKVVFLSDHVLVRIELRGAIVELAPKSKMALAFWSCEYCVKLFTFMLISTQS